MGSAFRLGISPARDPEATRARAEALARALEVVVHRPVTLHWAADYHSLVAGVARGDAQLAWLPPLAAADAVVRGAVVPIAITVRGGRSSYGSVLFAKKGGAVRTLDDLRDVRAAWVDRESAGGFAAIRVALRAAGLRLVDAFRDEAFLRSHAGVARAVLEGRADVGATYLERDGDEIHDAGWRTVGADDAFHVVAESRSIPSDFFGAHASVGDSDLAAIRATLVDARPALAHRLAKELSGADRFAPPSASWTAALHDLASNATEGPPSSASRSLAPPSSPASSPGAGDASPLSRRTAGRSPRD